VLLDRMMSNLSTALGLERHHHMACMVRTIHIVQTAVVLAVPDSGARVRESDMAHISTAEIPVG
jgi:hypothetical protein